MNNVALLTALGWRDIYARQVYHMGELVTAWRGISPDGQDRTLPDLTSDAGACIAALNSTGRCWRMTYYQQYEDIPAHCVVTIFTQDSEDDIDLFRRGATPCEAMLKALAAYYKVTITDVRK